MRPPITLPFALILLAAGCGGGMQSTIPRPADLSGGEPVQGLFAEDTASVAWVDLAGIRGTELYGVIGEDVAAWSRAIEEMGQGLGNEDGEASDEGQSGAPPTGVRAAEEEAAGLLSVLDDAEWLLVAGTAPRGADDDIETVTLVGGRLTEAHLRALVKAEAEEMTDALPLVGDEPQSLLTGGLTGGLGAPVPMAEGSGEPPADAVEVHEVDEEGRHLLVADDVVGTRVTEGVWIVGPRERVDDVIARIEGRQARTARIRTSSLDEVVDPFEHQVALTLADLDQVRERTSLLEALRGEGDGESAPGDDWWSEVEGAALTVDMGEGLAAGVVLQAADEPAARNIASETRRSLRDAIDDDVLGVMGLPRLLRQIHTRQDDSRVHLDLALDRAEAHLWWGKISGAIGAALVVVDVISGFFRGFAEGMGDVGEPEMPVPPGGTIEGSVVGADTGAPAQAGARCTAQIIPGESQGFGWTCHATVECDGKTLYGGPDSGWFPCQLGTADDWFVVGEDTEPSSVDGDATFHLDTIERRIEITDDVQGTFGDYRVEIQVESAEPEPALGP